MKLIIPRTFFGPVYVDTKNELKLGPFDFAIVGPENVAVVLSGKLSVLSFPRKIPSRRKK